MKFLHHYIEKKNAWRAIFDDAPIAMPLDDDGIEFLADSLGGELSPENLHCDGEISRAQAHEKYEYLTAVQADLEKYADVNNLCFPEVIY